MLPATYRRYAQLLPMLILLTCCLATLAAAGLAANKLASGTPRFTLSPRHYLAFAATGSTLAAFFFLRSRYKYFLITTILLGLFDFIQFTVTQFNIGFGFGELRLSLNVVALVVGGVAYLLNQAKINAKLGELLKPSAEKAARLRQEEIEKFKATFTRKSTAELAQLVSSNKLVPGALVAAQQLLKERQLP